VGQTSVGGHVDDEDHFVSVVGQAQKSLRALSRQQLLLSESVDVAVARVAVLTADEELLLTPDGAQHGQAGQHHRQPRHRPPLDSAEA